MPRLVRAVPAGFRAALAAALAPALLGVSLLGFVPAVAAADLPDPKVVVIVGPVGDYDAHYKSDADAIAAEAKKYTPNVTKIYTPYATWSRVRNALQGANVVVYLGHGNGWPSIYTPWQPYTKDGFGLDPETGADGDKHVYYGEYYIARDIRLAPNAVVLFYHLCYASGNTEPGLATGTFSDSKARVDNYGAGFLAAGARAVFADGHPYHPPVDYVRQLFTTRRTVDQMFRADPAFHGHVKGPYDSVRTPGLKYELDPDIGGTTPSGFYRSVVGQLDLSTLAITGAKWAPTNQDPSDFVVPGAAEVTATAGVPLFDSNAAADDPAAAPVATLAAATRLRLTATGTAMPDGTRVFAAQELDGSPQGWVRATGLTPRDSLATKIWTLDRPAAVISPNGDGASDAFALGVRFSEPVTARLTIRDAAGATIRSTTLGGDILTFTWDLTVDASRVPDGSYSWTLSGRDGWGNPGATASGTFKIDSTAPVTTAAVAGTAGDNGWLRSAATVTLSATDATSGVAKTTYSVDGGSATTYAAPVQVSAQGRHTLTFRSTDNARNVEATRSTSFSVDSAGPVVTSAVTGVAGDVAGWYRSNVSLALAATDATSGVASATYRLDGGDPAPLPATVPVVGDGAHSVAVRVTDQAGNVTTRTFGITVDTVAPVLTPSLASSGTAGAAPAPLFSPNGDGYQDTYRQSFRLTEAATVTVAVRNGSGSTVRTLKVAGVAGSNGVTWDGRTSSGSVAPDGHYLLVMTARDKAGNVSVAGQAPVDLYTTLSQVHRRQVRFYPQDRDTLAQTDTLTFTLRRSATVTLRIRDAAGRIVRTRWSGATLAAGTYTWAWDGRRPDGTFAPQGSYLFDLTATNGSLSERRRPVIYDGAFEIKPSATSATRGGTLTVTTVSSETLAANPRLYVAQPGLATWSTTMSYVSPRTYRVTLRLKTGGSAGTLRLYVVGTDYRGGVNRSTTLGIALA